MNIFRSIWSILIGGLGTRIFKIDDCLFQSGHLEDTQIPRLKELGIDYILDLEGGIDSIKNEVRYYNYWPIDDAPSLPDLDKLWQWANIIFLATLQGINCLIH